MSYLKKQKTKNEAQRNKNGKNACNNLKSTTYKAKRLKRKKRSLLTDKVILISRMSWDCFCFFNF